jgi:GAF domain-containing protein
MVDGARSHAVTVYSMNEAERLRALRDLDVLDTPPEAVFDSLTRLAALTFNTPVALVSLVDADRQWFKSCIGLNVSGTPPRRPRGPSRTSWPI